MAFEDIFGKTLSSKDGDIPTQEALSGKTAVGIYFSAHWCPPCRGFTPKLAEWYTASFKAKGMEIVFASSDRDEDAFKSYFAEQPWLALPFSDRATKEKLSKQFKVQGIPSFVIIGPDGKTITTDGRTAVSKDPTGEKYPWIPPTPAEKAKRALELLGSEITSKAGDRPIGLYFSAHWCPPCRGFTPKLAEYYNEGLKDNMEIVFVSSDKDSGQFDEYFKEMPWLALPYDKRDEKGELSDLFDVQGIPSFAVIRPDGTTITTEGRSQVTKDPKGENLPNGWLPQPFNDVNDDPSPLNEEKCIIILTGSESSAATALKGVAAEEHEKAGKDISAMPVRFFYGPEGGVVAQLRNLTKVEGEKMILLDIPDDGGFYVCDQDVSSIDGAAVKEFLKGVNEKKVERKQLQK